MAASKIIFAKACSHLAHLLLLLARLPAKKPFFLEMVQESLSGSAQGCQLLLYH